MPEPAGKVVLGMGDVFIRPADPERRDALVARLEAEGVLASHHEAMAGVGHFARIHDAGGNAAKLREPE